MWRSVMEMKKPLVIKREPRALWRIQEILVYVCHKLPFNELQMAGLAYQDSPFLISDGPLSSQARASWMVSFLGAQCLIEQHRGRDPSTKEMPAISSPSTSVQSTG